MDEIKMDEIKRVLLFLHLDRHPLAQTFQELAVCRLVPRQTHLVTPDVERSQIFFLVSGLLRGYFVHPCGGEITDCFCFRYGDSRMSFLPAERQRVEEYVEALEDTVVISFEARVLMPYLFRDPELMNICMARMADIYAEQILHKRMLCHTTAAERYRWFLDAYPGIIDRAPHRCIASFLNMTPVTLSRLRKEERLRWEVQ